jgi:hypothetical protein
MQTIFALLAAALAPTPAAPQAPLLAPREESIPFIRSDSILEWRADGDRGLFIRSMSGQWYHARTMARCGRLTSALTVGFETRGPDRLDRYGTLRVEGWRCPLASVTLSDGPPRRRH